ncbi:hypothetical protein [Haladaptatus halobius]|nr:hypothetical protein [Haladaptatus halobius]
MTRNDRDSPDDAAWNPRTTVRRGDDRSAASSDLSRRTLLGAVAAVGIA